MGKRWFTWVAWALAALLPAAACFAKSYSLESFQIEASVTPAGFLRVTEHLAFEFDGAFSYAYRDIPLAAGEELAEIRVGENGRTFRRSDDESPETFSVSTSGGRTRITWRFEAEDESRTFVVSYAAAGVVRRYPDAAEIYYKFVGDEWDRPVGSVNVTVALPESIEPSSVRAWAHGPLHGRVDILDTPGVSLSVSPLPARTAWEVRIVCPGEIFEALPIASGGQRLPVILREEAAWADESNRLRQQMAARAQQEERNRQARAARARELLPVAILLCLVAAGVWFQFFLRHGRPHPVAARTAPGEVPSAHAPAAISYLIHRTVSGPAVAATLLDLASRGHLEVRESVATVKGFWGGPKKRMDYRFDVVAKPASDLQPFERDLLQFILNEAGDSTGFSILALRKAASKKSHAFRRFFRKWNSQVGQYCKTLRFYEPYPVGAMVTNALVGLAILAAGAAVIVVTDSWIGAPAMIAGGLQAAFTVFLTRRTPEGQRLASAWKAFRSHLKSVSRALGPVTLASPEWGRYIVAAVLFGLHKRVLANLRLDGAERGGYPVWFYGALGDGGDGGISGLASGISSMVDAVSTSASSAAGSGGGASVGGGGGSGGGGGGAG